MEEKRRIIRSAGVMGSLTVVSRIFGLFRDIVTASLLGTGTGADAFTLAYRIPNLLRRLVGEGTMTAAFIPVFTEYRKGRDKSEVWELADRFFYTLGLVLVILSLLGIIFSPAIVRIIGFGFAQVPGKIGLTASLSRIMFFYLAFIGLSALAMAILNSFDIFAPSAFTPVLLNISIIVSAYLLAPRFSQPAYAFAIGVLLGGALQLGFQIPFLIRLGMRFRPGISFSHPAIRRIGRLMVPGIFGAGVIQINVLVSSAIASMLPEGAVASLTYANRLTEFTLGVFAVSVSTVILPLMSRQALLEDLGPLKETLNYAMRLVFFITIPSAVGLLVLREPIVALLLRWGRFGAHSLSMTSFALLFFALGLPAVGGVRVVAPAFYSLKDIKTPVKVAAVAMVGNIALALILMKPLAHGGIAFALSLSAYLNLFLLLLLFRRRAGALGGGHILASLLRIGASSAMMGGFCLYFGKKIGLSPDLPKLKLLFLLFPLIFFALLLYGIIAWLLGSEEVFDLLDIIKERLKRKG